MKFKVRILAPGLLLILTFSFSRASNPGWEFRSASSGRVAKSGKKKVLKIGRPEEDLAQALDEFTIRHEGRVQYRFSGEQAFPVLIAGFRSRAYVGDPEAQARAFLEEHRSLLGAPAENKDLIFLRSEETFSGRHAHFQPSFLGLPIYQADVGVHLNHQGEVLMVTNRVPLDLEWSGPPLVTCDPAITTALSVQGIKELRLPARAELIVYPERNRARPAWKVEMAASNPLGDWRLIVDAQTSEVLETRNLLRFADGAGKVFDPNPVVTTKNNKLRDSNHSATAVPASAFLTRTLRGLDGTGTLSGLYANTSLTANRANESSLNFNYLRSDKRFVEVNAYYQVDSMQRYIQSLGFKKLVNRSVPMNVHAQKYVDGRTLRDDSYFSPLDGGIYFGDGGVYDAEDGEIIAHEYGHAILGDQVPGIGETGETGALTEGFADYWAASYFSDASGGFQDACIADWDATAYSTEDPPCRTRVDRKKHYPEDLKRDPKLDGEIWSAALWQIKGLLGRDKANQLILESHYLLSPVADFREAAYAILQADLTLLSGANQTTLRQIFLDQGIFTTSDNKTVPLFSDITQSGTIDAGATSGGKFSPVQYTLVVASTAGKVRFDLHGLDTGDIDLFVRRNKPVAIGSDGVPIADARSQTSGGDEMIVLDVSTAPRLLPGTYYVTLANFSSRSIRYQISATVTTSVGETVSINSGETKERTIPAAQGGTRNLDRGQFLFEAPAGTTTLRVDLVSTTTANLFLYGRFGARVQMSSAGSVVADLFGEETGMEQHFYLSSVSIPALRTGEYFIAVTTVETTPIEYSITITASSAPLDRKLYFPLILAGKEPLLGSSSFVTGMAVLNDSSQVAILNIAAIGPDGSALADPLQRVLQKGAQMVLTVSQLFNFKGDQNLNGWIEISSNVTLKGFYLLFDSQFSKDPDGSDVGSLTSKTLIFPHVERHGDTFNTLVSLCNPSNDKATALYQEYNQSGQKVFSDTIEVPARGSFMGGTRGFDRDNGFVKITSDVPLVGAEFFGGGGKLAGLRAVPPGGQNLLVFPHFVVNKGYATTLSVSNPSIDSGKVLLSAFRLDGDLRTTVSRDLEAHAQINESVLTLFNIPPTGSPELGFLRVQSNALTELVGFTKIEYSDSTASSIAAVPGFNTSQKTLTFSHVANNAPSGSTGPNSLYTTGITLLADDTDAECDIVVYNRNGEQVAISNTFVLKKGTKISKLLASTDPALSFITPDLTASSGYLRVRAKAPVFGFELFFTRDLQQLALVPPQ